MQVTINNTHTIDAIDYLQVLTPAIVSENVPAKITHSVALIYTQQSKQFLDSVKSLIGQTVNLNVNITDVENYIGDLYFAKANILFFNQTNNTYEILFYFEELV